MRNTLLNTIAIVAFLMFAVAPPIFGDELTHRFKNPLLVEWVHRHIILQ